MNNNIAAICLSGLVTSMAQAQVLRYTNFVAWQSAVGYEYSTIDFTGWPQFTFITDQYSHLGIQYIDGNDFAWQNQAFIDGAGLVSGADNDDGIGASFNTLQYHVGFHFIGVAIVILSFHGQVIYTSSLFSDAITNFGGLVSAQPFDSVRIYDPSDPVVVIDNLYFGPPVPAPGALALLGIAAVSHRRRRLT